MTMQSLGLVQVTGMAVRLGGAQPLHQMGVTVESDTWE